jgi:hypothetical protein
MCRAAPGWPPRRPGWPDVEPRPKHRGRLPAGVSSAAVRQPRDDRLLRRAGAHLIQPGLLRRADADAPTRRSADSDRYLDSVRAMRALEPEAVYSTHLPLAVGIAQPLCDMLAAAADTDRLNGAISGVRHATGSIGFVAARVSGLYGRRVRAWQSWVCA